MEFKRNGIIVSVADQVVEQLLIEKLRFEVPPAIAASSRTPPNIGDEWAAESGVYCGTVSGHVAGLASDYHLILLNEVPETSLTWDGAIAWAKELKWHGASDWSLPFRREQSILFGNVPRFFEKECYWSCEQHAGDAGCAWSQLFALATSTAGARATTTGSVRSAEFPFSNSLIQ